MSLRNSDLGLRNVRFVQTVVERLFDKAQSKGECAYLGAFGLLFFVLLFGFSSKPQRNVKSIPVRSFLDSLGVCVHMEYTDGKYANVAAVLNDLHYLGITRVRDGVPLPNTWMPPGQGVAALNTLAASGIRFVIVMAAPDLNENLLQLVSLETAHPGMIAAIEGPNEINNWPVTYQGSTGPAAAIKFQRDMYAAVRSNLLLNKLPVFYLTGGPPANLKRDSMLADAANEHPYPKKGEQPGELFIQAFLNDYSGSTIDKVITETGYRTQPESQDAGGVDGMTQAKGILAIYFEAMRQGISATYLYQLLDPYLDPAQTKNDDHFGLFEYDSVPKPAAVAIHNLTNFLTDTASSSSTFSYGLTDQTSALRSLLLSKSDGSFVLALWNAVPFWNPGKREPIDAAPTPIGLVLSRHASVERFDPLTNETKRVAAVGARFKIDVPDHPILISIKTIGK